jgi:hypothetical protein
MTYPLDPPRTDADVLDACTELLQARFPPAWRAVAVREWPRADFYGLMTIRSNAAEDIRYVFEVKRTIKARSDVASIAKRLRIAAIQEPNQAGTLVMSRYLPPTVREALEEEAVSFIDATGNLLIKADRPALYIRDRGADKDPWRGPGRPRQTLAGEPAARVVRTLIGARGPWSARELVKASGASTGATYRVLDYLQEQGLVSKSGSEYSTPDWARLLRSWSRDYAFFSVNRTYTYIEPRGIPKLLTKVADSGYTRYAVTGSVAAVEWAPYAPARAAMIYVQDANDAAAAWGVRPAEKGGNVVLAEPDYDIVFRDKRRSELGYMVAAPEQVAVDLLTGPGRNPSEGEELIKWMQDNESEWRRA